MTLEAITTFIFFEGDEGKEEGRYQNSNTADIITFDSQPYAFLPFIVLHGMCCALTAVLQESAKKARKYEVDSLEVATLFSFLLSSLTSLTTNMLPVPQWLLYMAIPRYLLMKLCSCPAFFHLCRMFEAWL